MGVGVQQKAFEELNILNTKSYCCYSAEKIIEKTFWALVLTF
jgi:hypothetical protein